MICPVCSGKLGVVDTVRDTQDVYRRRKCKACGRLVYTLESEVEPDIVYRNNWITCDQNLRNKSKGRVSMIKVGQKVRFNPFKGLHTTGLSCADNVSAEGTVISVHAAHQWFGVEYSDDGNTWRTSFKFDDIGENVEILE